MMNSSVSIIIPVRNEEKFISKCIESILNQTYPQKLIEIIIVDGISTDKTIEVVAGYEKKFENIKIIKNEKKVTPVAMNLGIKSSKSEIVIILGAHSFIDKDFVKNNVRNLIERNVDCSGGVVKFIDSSFLTNCIGLATSCLFGAGNALFRYSKEEKYVDTVPFGAYKKSTIEKIGYFDEELIRNQDDELNYRVTEAGGKILLSPDIISHYFSRSSLKKLWKQYYQYGFWKVRVIQKHKKPASLRHLVPAAFTLSIFINTILGIFLWPFRYLLLLICLSYLFFDLFFSIKLSLKNGFKYFFHLTIIFPILHFSYGVGFINGFINFYLFGKNKI